MTSQVFRAVALLAANNVKLKLLPRELSYMNNSVPSYTDEIHVLYT